MAVSSWPFAGEPTSEDQYSRLFRHAATDGVTTVGGFNVTAGTGMQVQVAAGLAVVRGHMVRSTATETLSIAAASGSNRIDRVVLRLDPSNNEITLEVKQGTPASNPTPPALTQNDVTTYEIGLALVSVTSSTVNITNGLITDERLSTGVVVRVGTTAQRQAGARVGELYWDTDHKTLIMYTDEGVWSHVRTTWSHVENKPSSYPPSSHTHAAGDITSGTLNAARIPNLPASRIASGTLDPARLPADVDFGNITANSLAVNGITLATNATLGAVSSGIVRISGSTRQIYVGGSDGHVISNPVTTSDSGTPSWRSTNPSGSAYVLARFTSSKRYKTDIKPLDATAELDRVRALRPVTFKSKHEADAGKTLTGLIAEEVHDVLPDVVTLDDKQRPDSISLDGLVPHLVAAIQAQQTHIDTLEKRLDALEKATP